MKKQKLTPKQRVLAVHPDAVCEEVGTGYGRWRVFSHRVAHQSKQLGESGSTPNFAWQHAAMVLQKPKAKKPMTNAQAARKGLLKNEAHIVIGGVIVPAGVPPLDGEQHG
jgi:hypothetical protein